MQGRRCAGFRRLPVMISVTFRSRRAATEEVLPSLQIGCELSDRLTGAAAGRCDAIAMSGTPASAGK